MTHSPAGSSAPHIPVMLAEVLEALSVRDGGTYVDGTFGAGGYSRCILDHADCQVFGIDRDPDALAMGAPLVEEFEGRLKLLEGRFSQMAELVGVEGVLKVDGIVLDIGVSSMQLDRAERGFSFMSDGPLNMRMDQGAGDDGPTAADVVNTCPEGELATIFWRLGDEKKSRRIARAIVDARAARPIETTGQLAEIIERSAGGGHQKIHPATRTFQALRIYVNRELEELAFGLAAAERLLVEGGRLAVVSFHSLEDRIVKSFFKLRSGGMPRPSRHVPVVADEQGDASFRLVHRGAVAPGKGEVELNPRARSAKLRVGERTGAEPVPLDLKAMSVPAIGGA